jgi:chlorite dismutase
MVPQSRYAPEHRPAFIKGAPPRDYLSMYPFIKTHQWYQLPFERRRELMGAHGRMGQKHSAMPEVRIEAAQGAPDNGGGVAVATAPPVAPIGQVLANTIHSFGLGDQEFVVAFESDDPAALVHMVEDLRAAEVRVYTSVDTPVFLGRRKSLAEALGDLG